MEDIEFQPLQITPVQVKSFDQEQSSTTKISNKIVQEDITMVEGEIKKIAKMKEAFVPLINKIRTSKNQGLNSIEVLSKEAQDLKNKIQAYETQFEASKEGVIRKVIEESKKDYIKKWEERISTASSVNIQPFLDLDLDDRKSIANQLFKWIIVGIYGQPQSKFYWPNFKQQLFEKDQGKDFKQRLGKINASSAKQQQIIKMKDFLTKYDAILDSQQIKEYIQSIKPQAQKFKKIAQIFIDCHHIAKNSLQLQQSIQSCKQQSLKKDEQALKWKAKQEALQQRISVYNEYIKTIEKTQKQMEQKQKTYEKKQKLARQILSKLKKGEQIDDDILDTFAGK